MPVSDNNPERRNLTVTSLCFSAYFLAGGHFPDFIVRLQVVNVEFKEPAVLAFMAWGMLLWFTLRYWQKNRGSLKSNYIAEIASISKSRLSYSYLLHKTKLNFKGKTASKNIDFQHNKTGGYFQVSQVSVINKPDGPIYQAAKHGSVKIPINGPSGYLFYVLTFIYLAFSKPAIGSYLVPYLLFLLAITSAIYQAM